MDKSLMLSEIKSHFNFKKDSEFAKFLGLQPQVLSNWKKRGTFDIEVLYTKCVVVNSDWLITGQGEMLKSNNHLTVVPNLKGIPLIPIDAIAGYGTGEMQIMDYDTERYVVPEFSELNVDYMIRVKGSSMYPKYNSGDLVACKKLPLDTFFQWNKVYVLDTIQGPMIKRIHQSDHKNAILCVSDNDKYKPFDLNRSELNSLAIVVGVIRME